MKKIKILLIIAPILLFNISCEITDLDDVELKFQVSSENAFTSESSVESAYEGMYNKTLLNTFTELFGPVNKGQQGILVGAGLLGGDHLTNSYNAENISGYAVIYEGINVINNFIAGIESMEAGIISEERKNEVLGEAMFLRAFSNLQLLSTFGQFWDLESQYGNVLKTTPSSELVADPRSSVQETYDLIFSDLDQAIANAPDFSTAIYASKEAAKAFKAKTLMYAGKFAEAIPLLEDLMSSGTFTLESNYDDIFENSFDSSEAIFANYWDLENNNTYSKVFWNLFTSASSFYDNILLNDPRRDGSLAPNMFPWLPPAIAKFPSENDETGTVFLMRLPEIYLMHGECVVRSGRALVDAQASVDFVRARVGLGTTGALDAAALLDDIRIEKIKELGTETGVSMEDIIRYHYMGDLDGLSLKPTLSSEHLFIWPIPLASIIAADGVVTQNPGY